MYRSNATHVGATGQHFAPILRGQHPLAILAGTTEHLDQLHIADAHALLPKEVLRIDEQDLIDRKACYGGSQRVVGAAAQSDQRNVARTIFSAQQIDGSPNVLQRRRRKHLVDSVDPVSARFPPAPKYPCAAPHSRGTPSAVRVRR